MTSIPTVKDILAATAFRPLDVDQLLDRKKASWVRFDPVLGYVPNDIVLLDGQDFSHTTYRHEPCGARKIVNYPDRPCRINTYGDSFTQCQQVSDGETWQEHLAAHLGEPVRNYGSGGYGVFTAWNRCVRMEANPATAAEYVILNLFVDDHIRNLDAARWIRTFWNERDRPADRSYPLHGLPWAHMRYDMARKTFVELPGKCANEEQLRALTDKEVFYQTFKDDQIVRLFTLMCGGKVDEVEDLEALAAEFGIAVCLRDPAKAPGDARRLHASYGFRSTQWLLAERILPFIQRTNRKLMLTLSYCMGTLSGGLYGGERYDKELVDWLDARAIPYVDLMALHKADYARYKCSIEDYVKSFYIQAAGAAVFGHYTPMANMFFAMAIKNSVVEWLDPKPQAYRG